MLTHEELVALKSGSAQAAGQAVNWFCLASNDCILFAVPNESGMGPVMHLEAFRQKIRRASESGCTAHRRRSEHEHCQTNKYGNYNS